MVDKSIYLRLIDDLVPALHGVKFPLNEQVYLMRLAASKFGLDVGIARLEKLLAPSDLMTASTKQDCHVYHVIMDMTQLKPNDSDEKTQTVLLQALADRLGLHDFATLVCFAEMPRWEDDNA